MPFWLQASAAISWFAGIKKDRLRKNSRLSFSCRRYLSLQGIDIIASDIYSAYHCCGGDCSAGDCIYIITKSYRCGNACKLICEFRLSRFRTQSHGFGEIGTANADSSDRAREIYASGYFYFTAISSGGYLRNIANDLASRLARITAIQPGIRRQLNFFEFFRFSPSPSFWHWLP